MGDIIAVNVPNQEMLAALRERWALYTFQHQNIRTFVPRLNIHRNWNQFTMTLPDISQNSARNSNDFFESQANQQLIEAFFSCEEFRFLPLPPQHNVTWYLAKVRFSNEAFINNWERLMGYLHGTLMEIENGVEPSRPDSPPSLF